ncbi:MAG: right-handed parallel beta-helix repeat-containing protein [Candidatus Bipolaricaulota bacterium]|nr:right-handed parallel beta-helix repeat-containing protein [Candidatus Bipolaricaulota bacterium]MDW8126934.1 right-handed parallel beta-helix repeat-containing protein [Candidatus Bipolaricaulota bacterium]
MLRYFVFCLTIALAVATLSGCTPHSPTSSNEIFLRPGQSIQAAIEAATSGATIRLSRGTWVENLRLEKSVVLRGEGPDATIIQAERPGPPVIWVGKEAKVVIEGITIKSGRGGYLSPELSSAGLFAAEQATVELRQVKVTQNAASAVFARDQASLALHNSELSENARYGVEAWGQARLWLGATKVVQNSMGGGWASEKSYVEADKAIIQNNLALGLWLRDTAAAKLWDTDVRENQGPGIRGQDGASVTILASRICANRDAGLELLGNATLVAYGTLFQENWTGLEIKGGSAEVHGCMLFSNRWDGLTVGGNSSLLITKTHISGGQGSGVAVSDKAMATLLENVIQNFPVAGVSGFSSNLVAGEANEIENTGVPLLGNVRPEVRKKRATPRWESLVFPNKDFPDLQSAIDALLPSGVLEIQTGHYQAGVTVDKPVEIRGNGDVVLCAVVSSAPVLSLVPNANLRLVGVNVTGGSEGLAMGAQAVAQLLDCGLWENGVGIKLWRDAQLSATRVSITRHAQGGVWLWDDSQAILTDCTVHGNEVCGIGAGGRSHLQLYRCSIVENGWQGGVLLREFAQAELWHNVFTKNKGHGVATQSPACVGSGPGFFGEIRGGKNVFSENYKGPVCPAELNFLEE